MTEIETKFLEDDAMVKKIKDQIEKEQMIYLPRRQDERFKYTDLNRLIGDVEIKPIEEVTEFTKISQIISQLKYENYLVLINGKLNLELSDYKSHEVSISLSDLTEIKTIDYNLHPMALINHQTNQSALKINIKQSIDIPLVILSIITDQANDNWVQPSILIQIKSHAKAFVKEEILDLSSTEKPVVLNALTSIVVEKNANLSYSNQTKNGENLKVVLGLHVNQAENSEFNYNHTATDALLYRHDIHVNLNEKYAKTNLKGIAFLSDNAHIDHHVIIEHKASNTQSNANFRAVASGKSIFVCNPKAIVHKGLKEIIAHQNSRNLSLDDFASINTKPELEIYSDDVQCTHGATIGQLDKQALFYLQSRGISEDYAYQLLIEAFLFSIIENFEESSKENAKMIILEKMNNYFI